MIYDSVITMEPIDKGWSGDSKYKVSTSEGERFLLRVSPIDKLERCRSVFEHMKRVSALGVPMCRPVEFGTCEEGAYSIQSWIDGEDAESVIGRLSADEQYKYGYKAGDVLAKIHTIPAPTEVPGWGKRFNAKIDRKITMYRDCPLKYENGDVFLKYVEDNRSLLYDRPQSYQHGDYHIGNMMIDGAGQLVIIDFDRDDYGDPWEEFNRIVWCAQETPLFASGMVDGYFGKNVPDEFWRLLALYICSNTLSSLPWAIPFGEAEIKTMKKQAKEILSWYDNMRSVLPSWYQHR